ncbi:hypothetical protein GCM10027347_59750 [Larkinella harenae]
MIAVTSFYKLAKAIEVHNERVGRTLQSELDRGYTLIKCGERRWYHPAEWIEGVITQDGNNVRIVAILAIYQRVGSFSRMMDSISFDGHRAVVVNPTPQLINILKSWRWKCRIVRHGDNGAVKEYLWARHWRVGE